MILPKNQAEIDSYLANEKIIILQFGSKSCAPCSSIKNKIIEWNKSKPKICHIYIDAEQFSLFTAQNGVFTVPTIFVYVENKLTIRESGYFGLEDILNKTDYYYNMIYND